MRNDAYLCRLCHEIEKQETEPNISVLCRELSLVDKTEFCNYEITGLHL